MRAALARLGLNPDGTVEVPAEFDIPGWYAMGPAPGDPGPAVILGHLDSHTGPAIFGRLSSLRPGDEVAIDRAGGATVSFRVSRVARYQASTFPSAEVYGLSAQPELRLITCAGSYSLINHRYSENLVVYASRL